MVKVNKSEEHKEMRGESRAEVLDTIKNPLVFYALALLVVEASLAVIVSSSSKLGDIYTFWSVIIMAGLFLVVVVVVTILTHFVPKNLMEQLEDVARSESRLVSEAASKAVILSHIRQTLKRLKYELGAFNKEALIGSIQENQRQRGLSQNIFLVYVKPVIEEILKNPQLLSFIDQRNRTKLEELLSNPRYSVDQVHALLDEIIETFE